jgi:hypothetical protein
MNRMRSKALQISVLIGLLALPGCTLLDGAYDEAARRECDNEIDGKSRVDCYGKADDARREKNRN